jgi:hypothetical protein
MGVGDMTGDMGFAAADDEELPDGEDVAAGWRSFCLSDPIMLSMSVCSGANSFASISLNSSTKYMKSVRRESHRAER